MPKNKHKHLKSKDMSLESWVTPVYVATNFASFPEEGDEDNLYCDSSTASEDDLSDATLYEWTGDAYVEFTGHRPTRPPQH